MGAIEPHVAMEELRNRLEDIGLREYFDRFVQEGFDSWETVLDITESDLEALNVKLGHRRKLQRAIFIHRRSGTNDALHTAVADFAHGETRPHTVPASPEPTTGKRKYKRHPKSDGNAPEKPLSAYVHFANDVRREIDDKEVSFAEMAKIVGERWKALSPEIREDYETMAQTAKSKYQDELARYKKTDHYNEYQDYLKEFKSRFKQRNENDTSDVRLGSHSRASSSSDIAALGDRSTVSFVEYSSRQSSAQRDLREDLLAYASSRPRTRTPGTMAINAGKLPASLRNAHSDPTPTALPPGATFLPPIATLHRQASSSISNATFSLESGPVDVVATLIPRPRMSNTRMSSDEGYEMENSLDQSGLSRTR